MKEQKSKRRRHINEHLRTGLANSGRAAGMGIIYDRYDDESFPDGSRWAANRIDGYVAFPSRTEEEKKTLDGKVINYQLTPEELEKYKLSGKVGE